MNSYKIIMLCHHLYDPMTKNSENIFAHIFHQSERIFYQLLQLIKKEA